MRFVERPTMLSMFIAAFSLPFGHVSPITARLPVALLLLGGCLLIYMLARRVDVSVAGSLLGVGLFLACPIGQRAEKTHYPSCDDKANNATAPYTGFGVTSPVRKPSYMRKQQATGD